MSVFFYFFMDKLRDLKGFSFVPDLFVESKTKDFISYNFLDVLLEPENVETYEQIIDNLSFDYSSISNRGRGFGDKDVNRNVTMFVANLLSDFLVEPEDLDIKSVPSLTDKLVISDKEIIGAYSVMVNAHAKIRSYDDGLFVNFWNIKRLLYNDYFENALSNNINIFSVRGLEESSKNYFLNKKNKKSDLVYTKFDLKHKEPVVYANSNFSKKNKPKLVYLNSQRSLDEKVDDVFTKEGEIYKKIPGFEKRKKTGDVLNLNEARNYLRRLNKGVNNKSINPELLKFVESEKGKKLLEHGGPITTSFLRYFDTVFNIVIEEYKK